MPHDRDGKLLSVGDEVLVPCRIKTIHDTEGYCNVDLETLQPMYPGDTRSLVVLNAKQVVKMVAALLLCLLPTLAQAQVPLQPDWGNPARVYGPVDGVAPAWSQGPAEPAPEPTPPPNMKLSLLAGGVASLSADASGVAPLVRIRAEARLSKSDKGPNIHVLADLTALPGESIALEDPQTYRALEFSAALSQPLPSPLLFSVYAEAGFASRLPSDPAPRDRSAKWGSAGFLFQTKDRAGRLTLGLGGDQRLSGEWVAAVQVTGHVKIREAKGVSVYLVGSAVLALDLGARNAAAPIARDSVRAGIAIGI